MATPAHDQLITNRYVISYPSHDPRDTDPYYADFHAYKALRRKANTYTCDFAIEHRAGNFNECDLTLPLECHHRHIEFAMMNSVDLTLLEPDYPGVSAMGVGKWIESAANLMLLCVVHHRTTNGVHKVSYSDYGSSFYIRNLFLAPPPRKVS
jgi:hypothetical protein